MPIYEYHCGSCNEKWEQFLKVDNRKEPETKPCPKCGVDGKVVQGITAPNVSHVMESTSAINKLNNASKFKEKLQQIHDSTPGSRLNSSSNIVEVK